MGCSTRSCHAGISHAAVSVGGEAMTGIVTKPEPNCPKCGSLMKLRHPRPDQKWSSFWGCGDYPLCKGSVQIDAETGRPDLDEDRSGVYFGDERINGPGADDADDRP
jgi:ssDNA-binding Zn-finger/Zn-ribbon topoisomerase 1